MKLKLFLRNGQAPGDILMMTCGVRDLKVAYGDLYSINVETTCMPFWENNPYLDDFPEHEADMVLNIGPKLATQKSHTSGVHFANAFRICLEHLLGRSIPQGPIKPDVHLSEWERERGPIIEGDYWLVTTGVTQDFTTKAWPIERWQEVVTRTPWMTFVQVGAQKHNHSRLEGGNVIDFVGKTEDPQTGFRDLFNLFLHCQGSMGVVSLQMHLSAAFGKPCVVVAGAREPTHWEAYPDHRYIHNQGALRCRKGEGYQQGANLNLACWRADINACSNKVGNITKCMDMIKPVDILRAMGTYYEGGRLRKPEKSAVYVTKEKPIFRVVCNAHGFMGGERSTVWLMKAMRKKGYDIQLVPSKGVCNEYKRALNGGVRVTNEVSSPCDILLLYGNDLVYAFNEECFTKVFGNLKAERKFLVLNYKIGKATEVEWTENWDGYFFLCSTLRSKFLEKRPGAKTFVFAPPVDLGPFLAVKPKYNKTLHLLKHSSQGDNKHPKDMNEVISRLLNDIHPSMRLSFMPGPSFLNGHSNVKQYSVNEIPVPEFLGAGNCYWYPLPQGYTDQGPRTIVEAMAAGLPVLGENRDGAKDRITEDTGWLCDSWDDYYRVIRELDHVILGQKGCAAKERAATVFDPNNWLNAIVQNAESPEKTQ